MLLPLLDLRIQWVVLHALIIDCWLGDNDFGKGIVLRLCQRRGCFRDAAAKLFSDLLGACLSPFRSAHIRGGFQNTSDPVGDIVAIGLHRPIVENFRDFLSTDRHGGVGFAAEANLIDESRQG